jgi:hypothetical protein
MNAIGRLPWAAKLFLEVEFLRAFVPLCEALGI